MQFDESMGQEAEMGGAFVDMVEAPRNVEFAPAPRRRRRLLPKVTALSQNEYSSSNEKESKGHDDM